MTFKHLSENPRQLDHLFERREVQLV